MEKYERITFFGSGTFSKVYSCKNRQTKVKYIIKCIDIEDLDRKEKLLLNSEISNIQNLDHPFIVHFVEEFEEMNKRYIVMEYCNRGDLNKSIHKYKVISMRYDEKQIVEYLYQIFMATAYIHNSNVIHRDMKPENIFLHQEVEKIVCKIGDFGLSRVIDKDRQYAMTFVGSPLYMAPELVKGLQYNNKVDVWSIGCIIYELCTLDPLFYDPILFNILSNIQSMDIPELPFRFSDELKSLFRGLLERDPDKRLSCLECLESPIFNIPELNRLKVSSTARTIMRNHSVSQPFCDLQRHKFADLSVKDDIHISTSVKYHYEEGFDDSNALNQCQGINNSIRSIDQVQMNTSTNQKSPYDNNNEPLIKFDLYNKVDCNRTLDDSATTFLPRKPVSFRKIHANIHDESANDSVFEIPDVQTKNGKEENISYNETVDMLTDKTYNVYYIKDNSLRIDESIEESNIGSDERVEVDTNCYKLKKFLNEPDGIINLSKKAGRSYNYKVTNHSFNIDNPKFNEKISYQIDCKDPYKKQLILAKDNKADISEILSDNSHRSVYKRSLSANNSLQNLLNGNSLSTSTSFFDKSPHGVENDISPENTVTPTENRGQKKRMLKKKIIHNDTKKRAKLVRKTSILKKNKSIAGKEAKLNIIMKQNIQPIKPKRKYDVENVSKVVVGHNNLNCSGHSLSQTRNLNNISITNHTFITATGAPSTKKIIAKPIDKHPNRQIRLTPVNPHRSNSCDIHNNMIDQTNQSIVTMKPSNIFPTKNVLSHFSSKNIPDEQSRIPPKISTKILSKNSVSSINDLTKSRLESSTHSKKTGLSHFHPSINLENKGKYQLTFSTSSIGKNKRNESQSKLVPKNKEMSQNVNKNISTTKLNRTRKSNADKKHNETAKTYYPNKGMSIEYNMLVTCLKSYDYVGILKFLHTRDCWLPMYDELDLSSKRLLLQRYNTLIKLTIQFFGFTINSTAGITISVKDDTLHESLFKIKQWISDIRYYKLISSLLISLFSFPDFHDIAVHLHQSVILVINKFCNTKKLSQDCLDEKNFWAGICERYNVFPNIDTQ